MRIVVLTILFLGVQVIVASLVQPGDLRGGLLAYLVVPSILIGTWLLFGVALAMLRKRGAAELSIRACIGYAFLLALISAFAPLIRLAFVGGHYGPGP